MIIHVPGHHTNTGQLHLSYHTDKWFGCRTSAWTFQNLHYIFLVFAIPLISRTNSNVDNYVCTLVWYNVNLLSVSEKFALWIELKPLKYYTSVCFQALLFLDCSFSRALADWFILSDISSSFPCRLVFSVSSLDTSALFTFVLHNSSSILHLVNSAR